MESVKLFLLWIGKCHLSLIQRSDFTCHLFLHKFDISLQTFRFKTRLQRLNNIEASSRAKLNFLEQLYQYHKQQGNSRVVIPTINHKPLDLWLLRKEVHKLGGYEAVGIIENCTLLTDSPLTTMLRR